MSFTTVKTEISQGSRDGPKNNSAKPEFRLHDPEWKKKTGSQKSTFDLHIPTICLSVCLPVLSVSLSLYINKHTIKKNKATLNIYVKTKIFFWKIFI